MKDHFKYFYILFFLGVFYLSFLVIQPVLGALVMGGVIAYIFYPLFQYLNIKIKNTDISAFAVSVFIIALFSIPSFIIIDNAGKEAQYFYIRAKQKIATGELVELDCSPEYESIPCKVAEKIKGWFENPQVQRYTDDILSKFSAYIFTQASDFVFRLPQLLLELFIAFFVSFYLFIDGKYVANRFKNLLPIEPKYQKEIHEKIDSVTHAVIYGSIIVALIQGALGALGFLIFGVPSPILWGLVMSILALIPFLGTPIVWGPAGLFIIIDGLVDGQTTAIIRGVGLLIYGTLIISTADNILKPKLIADKAKVHPVVVLIGVFGGLSLMGFVGFIVGPLILALLQAVLEVYEKEKRAMWR